jgi:hypothetical protein
MNAISTEEYIARMKALGHPARSIYDKMAELVYYIDDPKKLLEISELLGLKIKYEFENERGKFYKTKNVETTAEHTRLTVYYTDGHAWCFGESAIYAPLEWCEDIEECDVCAKYVKAESIQKQEAEEHLLVAHDIKTTYLCSCQHRLITQALSSNDVDIEAIWQLPWDFPWNNLDRCELMEQPRASDSECVLTEDMIEFVKKDLLFTREETLTSGRDFEEAEHFNEGVLKFSDFLKTRIGTPLRVVCEELASMGDYNVISSVL